MSESGGMNVNRLTAGGQTVATYVKGNITTLPANLRPTGATTAMNLTWDSDNTLRSADIDANGTADVNFQYEALRRRVARTGTEGSVVYVQMDQQTIADYPVGGAVMTPTFLYVYASYIDEPVVRKTAGTGGTLVYFHRNHQYSITAVTTSTGTIAERYAYTAYGQPTVLDASASVLSSSAINNRYTYTGREWDATLGLHHFRARWMSPSAGRFLTRDPIGYLGSEWGLYEFVNSKSLNLLDPLGEEAELTIKQVKPTNLNPKCNAPTAKATFRFQLDKWPCRGNFGYFVQRVSVSCHVAPCNPLTKGEASDHFHYFEAWPVQRQLGYGTFVFDTASFSSSGLGRYRQDGLVKFYCLSPDNEVREGEIGRNETTNPGPGKFGVGGPCPTNSGALNSTSDDQPYWERTSSANSGHRTFGMNWNCCCDKSVQFASAFARP